MHSRGIGFVHIHLCYDAVAYASCASAFHMLLWRTPRAHCIRKCCCGASHAHICISNVAVANASCTSTFSMMLWRTPRAHSLFTCCRGVRPVHIAIVNAAVVQATCTLVFQMLLWWTPRARLRFPWQRRTRNSYETKTACCCGVRPVHIDFKNVAVAYVACTLIFELATAYKKFLENKTLRDANVTKTNRKH